ncbi:MAG TPA: hypothetical protein VK206_07770 [Anaerolineales bacterium]|nr:hypothetical protein [Anaerolineales bacterium]HLO29707.1 hypothetical protein [Anaerolineales bacterium]
MAIRYFITSTLGLICAVVGIWLRFAARDLAWPLQWSYSGPREDTIWAIREHAYQDVSLAILSFGLALIAIVLVTWLWLPARKPG